MSLTEIVEVATDAIERPDYDLEIPYVRSIAGRALRYVHQLRDFDQDLEDVVEPLTSMGSSATIALPEDYRHLSVLTLMDENSVPIDSVTFKRSRAHRRPSDSFGLLESNYYYILGQELRAWWAHNLNQGFLCMTYYKLPVISFDNNLNQYTTDSWIADRYPSLVSYEIAKILAAGTETSQLALLKEVADMEAYSLINDAEI